jgi:DNA (cytosine-5)-methyltransferase 3A
MNVLSLFDGISCGQIALNRAGLKIDNYFASEIDKYAIKVTMANYPNTIQLGSVVDVDCSKLPKIDILIGGSPCQSFSFAGKRNGMTTKDEIEILTLEHYLLLKNEGYEFEGQSYLFWEYMRILNVAKPKYFLLENVEMGERWEKILSKAIKVNGIHINSALLSAQNRKRIYWTNIGMKPAGLFGDLESIIQQPKDLGIILKDVLELEVDEKYFLSEKMIDCLKNHQRFNKYTTENLSSESKSKCLSARLHKMGNSDTYIKIDKEFTGLDINKKSKTFRTGGSQTATNKHNYDLIVHNTQRRSAERPSIQKNKNAGGCGHLSRNDGKTYSLDTQNTNAVEIVALRGRPNEEGTYTQLLEERQDGKTNSLTTVQSDNLVNSKSRIRRLTPIEAERLQTLPDNYTNHISDSQRYKCIGNGWTVDVIVHIFKYIKNENS